MFSSSLELRRPSFRHYCLKIRVRPMWKCVPGNSLMTRAYSPFPAQKGERNLSLPLAFFRVRLSRPQSLRVNNREFSNFFFSRCHSFALTIHCIVFKSASFLEFLIRLARLPKIQRQINSLPPQVAHQPRPSIRRISRKQLRPRPIRAVYLLKHFFASRLDFELP